MPPISSNAPRHLGAAYVPILLSEVEQEQRPSQKVARVNGPRANLDLPYVVEGHASACPQTVGVVTLCGVVLITGPWHRVMDATDNGKESKNCSFKRLEL